MRNYRGISWVDAYIFGSKDDRAYYKEGVQITKEINADLKEIMRHKEKMPDKETPIIKSNGDKFWRAYFLNSHHSYAVVLLKNNSVQIVDITTFEFNDKTSYWITNRCLYYHNVYDIKVKIKEIGIVDKWISEHVNPETGDLV